MGVIQDHIMFTPSSDLGFIIPYSDKGASSQDELKQTSRHITHTLFYALAIAMSNSKTGTVSQAEVWMAV